MAFAAAQGNAGVVIHFDNQFCLLSCDRSKTIAQVRAQWHNDIGRAPSVAFVTPDRRYLPDDRTIGEALEQNPNSLTLELHAHPKSLFWVQVFGFENTRAAFEVATILTPAAVRREMESAVGIYTDEFRLTCDEEEVDFERPFNAQGIAEGAELTLDLRVTVNVHSGTEVRRIECFGSETVGVLRQNLELDEDTVIVATTPYRRVLSDHLRICHVTSDLLDLQKPLDLSAEEKMILSFEPISLPHRRKQLPVAMSSTPLDIHEMVREHFELNTEFRLCVNGQELDRCRPLFDQLLDSDTVLQLDILRPCKVTDQWMDLLEASSDEEVCLYSTESPYGLFLRDLANEQHLMYEGIDLTLFGSIQEVFGAISGQHRSVLLVDRDVKRSLPALTFDAVERKLAWARNLLLEVVPTSRGLFPKEILCHGSVAPAKSSLHQLCLTGDSLITLDPLKVCVRTDLNAKSWSEKRLRIFRFAHGSTLNDVRATMQQFKSCQDIGLKTRTRLLSLEEMDRKLDLELLLLTNESKFHTKLTVAVNGTTYSCWFEPSQVTFSDIMVEVGKQAKQLPRHLFGCKLFCRGCGSQLSKEEEPHQAVPSNCCHVKSLDLTDRRVKAIGTQTAGSRRREAATETLYPEERDASVNTSSTYGRAVIDVTRKYDNACMNTSSTHGRAVIDVTRKHDNAVTSHPPPPPKSLRVRVTDPDGREEERTVTVESGSNCGALLAAASDTFAIPVGNRAMFYSREFTYKRGEELRRAVRCYDKKRERWIDVDSEDGSDAEGSVLQCSFRFLRPSSPLPSSPKLLPLFFIETDTEVLTIDPSRQLRAAPANALTDSAFVAAVRGDRSGAVTFWQASDWRYINAATGGWFYRSQIPTGGPRCHFLLVLRDGDPVPSVKNPTSYLRVIRRAGLQLRIEKNCVRSVGPPQSITDIERWDYPEEIDDFAKNFTTAARK